jgi:uncharacterized membrane protein
VPEYVNTAAEWATMIIESLGIVTITGVAVYCVLEAAVRLVRGGATETIFPEMRQRLGRGILLGLEFLVAADIIHTFAVELTFETLGGLAIVVLIRTFLSFTLEVELTGKWPWQHR